jgi:hypothetical protein
VRDQQQQLRDQQTMNADLEARLARLESVLSGALRRAASSRLASGRGAGFPSQWLCVPESPIYVTIVFTSASAGRLTVSGRRPVASRIGFASRQRCIAQCPFILNYHFTPLIFAENMAAMVLFGLIIAVAARSQSKVETS